MIVHGPEVSGERYDRLVAHVYDANVQRMRRGLQPVPLCVWGLPGIGKTQSVREFAEARRVNFLQINPAQFEEMGDLTGMPKVIDPNTPDDPTDDYTMYIMPEWAQQMHRRGGEGILLLDDVNRADDRILRGIMQLLQDRRMFNWALPERWQIFLTANPDGGEFSVTPMDDALLTRMMHATMTFDARAWAAWAARAGVDSRGIEFVLSYPELVGKGRTTPRSLTNLFEHLRGIDDFVGQHELVSMVAAGCIEPEAAGAFLGFVQGGMVRLPDTDTILDGPIAGHLLDEIERLVYPDGSHPRVDRIMIMLDRVAAMLERATSLPEQRQRNLIELLMWDRMPSEARQAFLAKVAVMAAARFLLAHKPLMRTVGG
jgi:hypothetical protein